MNSKSLALICLMLGVLLPLLACESSRVCPPSEPIYRWKNVPKPYPVVLKFAPLPPLVLPDYPERLGPDATEEEKKAWSLEIERVSKQRSAMRDARIEAFEERERILEGIEETYEIPEAPAG